ncbi:MAG: cupin domain-containing protein [Amaricoccus sp.]
MPILRSLLAGAALLAAAPVLAGECPAGKAGIDVREPVKLEAVGVTDTVLAQIPLSETSLKLEGRTMRVRRLTIEPGGIVPWHSHADRPALIVTVKGEIMEYASTCAAPIVHAEGDVARELPATSHWWKNLSGAPVELLSFDILHDPADTNM